MTVITIVVFDLGNFFLLVNCVDKKRSNDRSVGECTCRKMCV